MSANVDRLPRIAVIGAGFAGLSAARELHGEAVEVVVVDQNDFQTFQPLLYQVGTAGLNPGDVAIPIRRVFRRQRNATFRRGLVTGVDWSQRRVVLEDGQIEFDGLVLAGGSTTNYFGVDGAREHAFPLYGLRDAVHLRNHILECFETADAHPEALDDGLLTFVIVGAGPTGVELAGALSELVFGVMPRDFPRLAIERARVVLVEMLDSVLPPFGERSRRHARDTLEAKGVELRLGETVERVDADRVQFASGAALATHTLVWAAGVQAGPLTEVLDLDRNEAGRIRVEPDLRVPGHPETFAVGDMAQMQQADGEALPQLAPVAQQSGRHAARQMVRHLQGLPTEPFRYHDKGTMATIGRRAAVAEFPSGLALRGIVAWLAWLLLHLLFLMGARNRASVLVHWAWNYLTWDRGPRLILRPLEEEPVAGHLETGAA